MSSTRTAGEVWGLVVEELNTDTTIDTTMMNGFLKALAPQLLSDNSLILSTDNKWASEYITANYGKSLNKALSGILGTNAEVHVVLSDIPSGIDPQQTELIFGKYDRASEQASDNTKPHPEETAQSKRQDNQRGSLSAEEPSNEFFQTFHNQTESIESSTPSQKPDSGTKTFDSFVVADTNSYAYGAAYSVAENPGEINNPLFIYGRSGLGKTHLLLAIKDYVNKNYPEKKVTYSPTTTLVEDYVEALGADDWSSFTMKYKTADMLLLDDVQFLEGKEETTNEFFKIFNLMIQNKKQIVLSADRAPKDINLDERLRSRFANGVTADIQAPLFETKLKIFKNHIEDLKRKQNQPDLEIPNEVINRVVELSNSNIRNLEGAAASLVVYISFSRSGKEGPITVEEAEEIVSKIFFTNMAEKITISDIQRFVELYYNVTHGELLGSQRPRHISNARQVGMYLSRVLTQASYPEIGKAFKKDHSSVVHAYKNIESKRQADRDFFNEIERMSDLITSTEKEG
ncbi:MAG: chromosomal replication initiator protein DnaA [Coriobacteriales bacterium]